MTNRPTWPRAWMWLVPALLLAACASAPRPRVVTRAQEVAQSPAVERARELAPQVYAKAETLRADAEQAYQAGDLPASQVLAERAIAVYGRAAVLARLVTAKEREAAAQKTLVEARARLAKLDDQQARLLSETEMVEQRLKVLRDAEPLAELSESNPERQRARQEAARATLTEARLLCMAGLMVAPDASAIEEASKNANGLHEQSAKGAPLDLMEVTRARSRCLRELTLARRPKFVAAPAAGHADALLEELSDSGKLFVFRDDRGVVVVLRELLEKSELKGEAKELLTFLGRVAKAHPKFPVMVVGHSASTQQAVQSSVEAAKAALLSAGAPEVSVQLVGNALPVSDPKRPGAKQRNERVEVVFVAPVP